MSVRARARPRAAADPDHPRLLYNMSAPRTAVVTYAGLAALPREYRWRYWAQRPNPAPCPPALTEAEIFGTPVRFALPEDFTAATPEAVLEALGVEPADDPAAALERLLEARAAELPLPDGCLVVPTAQNHTVIWPDALSVLAVLAKFSDSLWLRAKTPSLASALVGRRTSLLVPPSFASALRQGWKHKRTPESRPG